MYKAVNNLSRATVCLLLCWSFGGTYDTQRRMLEDDDDGDTQAENPVRQFQFVRGLTKADSRIPAGRNTRHLKVSDTDSVKENAMPRLAKRSGLPLTISELSRELVAERQRNHELTEQIHRESELVQKMHLQQFGEFNAVAQNTDEIQELKGALRREQDAARVAEALAEELQTERVTLLQQIAGLKSDLQDSLNASRVFESPVTPRPATTLLFEDKQRGELAQKQVEMERLKQTVERRCPDLDKQRGELACQLESRMELQQQGDLTQHRDELHALRSDAMIVNAGAEPMIQRTSCDLHNEMARLRSELEREKRQCDQMRQREAQLVTDSMQRVEALRLELEHERQRWNTQIIEGQVDADEAAKAAWVAEEAAVQLEVTNQELLHQLVLVKQEAEQRQALLERQLLILEEAASEAEAHLHSMARAAVSHELRALAASKDLAELQRQCVELLQGQDNYLCRAEEAESAAHELRLELKRVQSQQQENDRLSQQQLECVQRELALLLQQHAAKVLQLPVHEQERIGLPAEVVGVCHTGAGTPLQGQIVHGVRLTEATREVEDRLAAICSLTQMERESPLTIRDREQHSVHDEQLRRTTEDLVRVTAERDALGEALREQLQRYRLAQLPANEAAVPQSVSQAVRGELLSSRAEV